jgi:hypothetical protein
MEAHEHLAEHVWKHPSDYGGFSPDGDYLVLSKHRESQLIDESNWDTACEQLAKVAGLKEVPFVTKEAELPVVYQWRAGHWAVGWVEYLMVRKDAPDEVLKEAGEIICSLESYPILDEDDYSWRQNEAIYEYWAKASASERRELMEEAGLNGRLPEDMPDEVFYRLSESEMFY